MNSALCGCFTVPAFLMVIIQSAKLQVYQIWVLEEGIVILMKTSLSFEFYSCSQHDRFVGAVKSLENYKTSDFIEHHSDKFI